ncbi:hypothetical protein E2C01_007698 [Portunus trituberculatus]|uniref:Uncharacterized protein n=1 Tax=Portunus trituberculatus TaxID=210409 RepID=A0A5B7CZP0_PORTR|nr:hypothetical protein [Portunus trituberculatus]
MSISSRERDYLYRTLPLSGEPPNLEYYRLVEDGQEDGGRGKDHQREVRLDVWQLLRKLGRL